MRSFRLAIVGLAAVAVVGGTEPERADPSKHWSFLPERRPTISLPGGANPVDAFVRAKLARKGLAPSPEADNRTLIRRVTLDLTGLPPTPAEIDAFLADRSADAYEKLVDRLLASPHYGERQARFWMDLVHYAETHGHDQDRVRPNAWRYRDYLIAAFNADTPYGRFVREQLAADVLFPDRPDLTPALGMMAAGPWDESSLRDIREDSIDRQVGYYLDRDDMVTTALSTFASLTVHCARCHDHKFDPITQTDYYRLQAVFAGVGRADRAFDPDPVVARSRAALAAAAGGAALPPPRKVYAIAARFAPDGSHKPTPAPRPVRVLRRGDIHRLGAEVGPGAVAAVPGLNAVFDLPPGHAEGERREALALWLTDPNNPLTWRSIVNRVWQQHFDRGIVDTPSDFGAMGGTPSHPELLDWLAVEFRDGGQSLKKLHRLIVTSATYRQSSAHRPDAAAADADNRLLWRMPRTRLDAEQVRDAVLVASGRLDRTRGGPSDQQFAMRPGIHVTPVVDYGKFDWDRPRGHRRSVYRFVFRTVPDPLVDCLDGADASQLTPARNQSVSAPQSLSLLNSEFVLVHAKAMAADLEKSEKDTLGIKQVEGPGPTMAADLEKSEKDTRSRVGQACLRLWGRAPVADELAELTAYADKHGLANLCRVLFNSNEFLFAD